MAVELLPKVLPKVLSRTGTTETDLTGGDIAALVQALGKNSNVAALYDVRYGVTVVSGAVSQWDDARGAAGFAPSLAQATGTKRPVWSASNLTMTFDGLTQDLFTPASSLFDLTGAKTVILIGAILTDAATKYATGICDAATLTRGLSFYVLTASSKVVGSFTGAGVTSDANGVVNASTTRRAFIVSKPADGSLSALDVPAKVRVTLAHVGNVAAGNNTLVVGSRWDTVAGMPSVVRAVIVLNSQVGAAEVGSITNWASTYHGITPA